MFNKWKTKSIWSLNQLFDTSSSDQSAEDYPDPTSGDVAKISAPVWHFHIKISKNDSTFVLHSVELCIHIMFKPDNL